MRARFAANIAATEAAANKMARVSNRSSPLMETLGGFAIALAIMYAGYRVFEHNALPGNFVSFLTAFLLAYEPAKRLARLNIDLNSAMVGVRVLLEVLDGPAGETAESEKDAFRCSAGKVVFSNVSFSYRAGEPTLCGISLTAEAGEVTALVGPSGGGKSTVLALLLRLYEPDSGVISIDGLPINNVSRLSLRRQIAYVGQDVFLFRGSIKDNIAFGRPAASETEIVAAAKAAFAHDFISAFPQGYNTPVGEHGAQLSGGQRQRIAVARALIKDAPIIILDEPTASLDSQAERQVQEAISRLCEKRTTIVVAHRLHTIQQAHCIYVVEEGAVTERGRHQELIGRNGRYAALLRAQEHEAGDPAHLAPALVAP
jgi:ATP-binding cassette subfamily B protein